VTDLAARLRTVVEERLAVARAASGDPWVTGSSMGYQYSRPGDVYAIAHNGTPARIAEGTRCGPDISAEQSAAHIALNNPADVILACEHALWLLDQHRWVAPGVNCGCDQAMCSCGEHVPWPCEDLQRLAKRYRVEVE